MKILYFLSLLLFFNICFGQSTEQEYEEMLKKEYKYTVPFIDAQSLYQKLMNKEKIYILDTRMEKEAKVSMIQGAVRVGYSNFQQSQIEEIQKDDIIVVYCTIGARSESIGEKILANGYTQVFNLYGGIINWVNKGYPVYNNKNQRTENVHVYSKSWGKWLEKGKAVY